MNMLSRKRLALTIRLAVVLLLPALTAIAPPSALAQSADMGEWSQAFKTPNVIIHAHLLPNGKVLFFSRREGTSLDEHDCVPRIWNPEDNTFAETPSPGYNLFCSGHTFLSDGRLFVVGGHLSDFHGSPRATTYDYRTNTWTAIEDTKRGRWYPTAVTLPDGGVLVSFGADKDGQLNDTQQVWKDGTWTDIVNFNGPPLYPRMHVISDGRVFMSGPLMLTQFLDTKFQGPTGRGEWTPLSDRDGRVREYAPSVLYDENKIVFIGGGDAPDKVVRTIDLDKPMPRWEDTDEMHLARRQHNATLLPDGTVLVTGGTQGAGFNNLIPGQPIRSAELWDPKAGHWTKLAKASVDRCYHSIAVLLPDATVLSAGGGEFRPNANLDQPNDPKDSHRDAQIFSPPYLFRGHGPRPRILGAPDKVTYGQTFTVKTTDPTKIGQVNWVRLSSVTHSFNTNQRINFLKFTTDADDLEVTAPASANRCPPGHYMLFVLDKDGVPSVARMIQIL